MAIKHIIFISYRRHPGAREMVERLKDDIQKTISSCAEQLPSTQIDGEEAVYFDEKMNVGDDIDTTIYNKLCQSLCMLVLYTPTYIHSKKKYCAKELLSFWKIHLIRNQVIKNHLEEGNKSTQEHIIPLYLDMKPVDKDVPREMQGKIAITLSDELYVSLSIKLSIDNNTSEYKKMHVKIKQKIREMVKFLSKHKIHYNDVDYGLFLPEDNDPELTELIENKCLPDKVEFPVAKLNNNNEF